MDLWMLHLGRFLTGVAGGMTAASIPVSCNGYGSFKKTFRFNHSMLRTRL